MTPDLASLRKLRDQPHEFLRARAPRDDRLARFGLGPIGFHFIDHPEDIQRVLVSNQANYSKDTFQYRFLSEITGAGLLTMDGPQWLERRRMEQPSFHRAEVERFIPLMNAEAGRMAASWNAAAKSGEPIDVAEEMLQVALSIVVRALFGTEVTRADRLTQATMTMLHYIMYLARNLGMVPRWLPTRRRREFRQAMALLDDAIYRTVERRRQAGQAVDPQAGTPDLLSRLLEADPAERLTTAQLRNEMITMIIAGHETVASALSWTWLLLSNNHVAEERLAREVSDALSGGDADSPALARMSQVSRVFQETLRLYPPAWIISRKLLADDELGGKPLRRGSVVVMSPYVTQRDERWWAEPDLFDPERFAPERKGDRPRYAYFPFGGGPHLCIGNHFSMLEAGVIISHVVREFRLELVPGHSVAADPGVTLTPRGGLPMIVKRRMAGAARPATAGYRAG